MNTLKIVSSPLIALTGRFSDLDSEECALFFGVENPVPKITQMAHRQAAYRQQYNKWLP